MKDLIETMMQRPVPTLGTTTSVSVTGTAVSFAETTLPLIQWGAALVAVISGSIGIVVGLYHLKNIINKEFFGKHK